ncbi:DUF4760 domain-containing protein [Fimbriimonas ginsengisoli]|uniref:DUF4760 domain-containing protein n=1 Tax=Fimbriimonas ginsengisoli TaxID=1005039 RepID=UPI00130DA797|nr:DUF4760 domain-containing protein [Fimbriimonas ginsengisoli]
MDNQTQAAILQVYAAWAGVLVTLFGFLVITFQLRVSAKASRTQNASTFMLGEHKERLLNDASEALGQLFQFGSRKQMPMETARKIMADEPTARKLSAVLNYYENVAAGVNCGVHDEQYVRLAGSRSFRIRFWENANYIAAVRESNRNPNLWIELERLCEKWDRWSNASPHFFENGQVVVGVPFEELRVPSEQERWKPRLKPRRSNSWLLSRQNRLGRSETAVLASPDSSGQLQSATQSAALHKRKTQSSDSPS